ncbi:MAG TPA: ADOP family duplicated permease [Gemmatimonadaceae bacterium]|nr:ADOP family duplicated permease [Gemmatimonadaceae bacterium]
MLDLRFLARRKALTAIAVLTMALALGANTAALAVLKAFLLSSLALPESDRVLLIAPERDLPGRGTVVFNEAYPNYQLLRETQRSFADVTVLLQLQASWDDHGEPRPLNAARASASFFSTMRVQPTLGRAFSAGEEGPSPAPVVVISHGLWTSSFGGDPGVVGRTMSLNGAPHTVIGVMPEGFEQPTPTDVWLPFDIPATQRRAITGGRQLSVYGRLADGISFERARNEVKRFTARAIEANPADNKDFRYDVKRLRDVLLGGADSSALFVQVGAATLLVLAILNLASLLVAWGFERRKEMAVRVALGASDGRVMRLLLQQSLAIVAAGAALGVPVAYAALRMLQQFDLGPTVTVLVGKAHVDLGVLSATAAIAAIAGLAAGALPAWLSRGAALGDALRASSRSSTLSPLALRWQKAMVVGQAALSTAILAASALIAMSLWRLSEIPDGFSAQGRVVARVVLPDASYGTHLERAALGRALDENLAGEPGIASAGFSSTLPVSDIVSGGRFFIELPDGSTSSEPALFHLRRVSPGYLETMGIPLLRGRTLTAQDDTGSVQVAIVSRALAARLWPNEDAIGKRLLRMVAASPAPIPVTVVGVAGNTMDAGYSAPAGEAVYLPYSQASAVRLSIVAKGRGDDRATIAALRRALRKTDPVIAASSVSTLDALVLKANALPRLRTMVLIVFSIVAVGIVSLGSYGVMSQLVSNRERELAVRLVFGARPTQLGASVLAQVARLTVPGIALGLAAVWSASSLLETFVFGVQARSPLVLAGAGGALLVLAVIATLSPAVRAMRVDIRRGIAG